jgi:hypothetical protein
LDTSELPELFEDDKPVQKAKLSEHICQLLILRGADYYLVKVNHFIFVLPDCTHMASLGTEKYKLYTDMRSLY